MLSHYLQEPILVHRNKLLYSLLAPYMGEYITKYSNKFTDDTGELIMHLWWYFSEILITENV